MNAMGRRPEEIEREALELDPSSRAALAKKLIDSLDDAAEEDLSPEEIEHLWAEEALRRYREIKEGKVETIPADEVMKELRSRRK